MNPVPARHRIMQIIGVGGLLLASSVMSDPVQASPLRDERAATRAGSALVAQAVRGELDAAFNAASTLGRENDASFVTALERQKQSAAQGATTLGAFERISAPEELFFAGCVTRSYLVHYAEGSQRWLLKFRRGNGGWYLSDLSVRNS